MSTSATRKGRRKLGLLASVFAAFGLFLAVGVGTAAAGTVSCVYDGATGTVTITISDNNASGAAADNTITIRRSGEAITVNGLLCADPLTGFSATVANVDQVNVVPGPLGADGNDALVIDQRGGLFIPGFTTGESPTTLNEIEFFADLGFERTSTGNTVTVYGTDGADGITAGNDLVGTNWDGAPVTGEPVAAPRENDYLVNLNAGLLTDDDADLWVLDNGGGIGGGGFLTSARFNLGGGDDVFIGKGGDGTGGPTSLPQTIDAGAGDDFIIGGIGNDTIIVGTGNDVVDGNLPVEGLVFCAQDDLQAEWYWDDTDPRTLGDTLDLSGQPGPATITLNPDGSVVITGVTVVATGIEHVIGTAGADTITGNGFSNYLAGSGGNDTIHGGAGDDIVAGNDGDDTLFGDENDDCVLGGDGNDTLNENTGVAGSTATATSTGQTLNTNGTDALDGGPGVDTVTYSERTTSIVVYLGLISTFNDGADLNQDGLSNEFDDVFFTTENAITGSGQDIISANFINNRANNVFTDNAGNDCLEGGPGNDTFEQGALEQGADVQIGNTGSDTSNYSGRAADAPVAVSLDGVANDGQISPAEGDNVGGFATTCRPLTIVVNPPFSGVPNLPVNFPFNLPSFVENPGFLFTDAPVAGPAPTLCNDINIIVPIRTTQGEGPGFCAGETLGGDQSPLSNVDVENVNGGEGPDELVGDSTGNVLHGNGGNDQVSGGAATDQLFGDAGDDLLRGGDGNDMIDGGEGNNTADYASAGAGGVGVQVRLTTGTATGEGNDTLKAIQNVNGSSFDDNINGDASDNRLNGAGGEDNISGNAGNDTINGGGAADQMSGQTGDDKISGAQGNDAIQGGAGNDWLQGGQGKDTILGQKGNDKLYGNAQPDFLNGGQGSDVCKPGSPGLARGDVVVNCER
jgi:Ca2+-binding RTX toxin-like protein